MRDKELAFGDTLVLDPEEEPTVPEPTLSKGQRIAEMLEILKEKGMDAVEHFHQTMKLLAEHSPDSTINPSYLAFDSRSAIFSPTDDTVYMGDEATEPVAKKLPSQKRSLQEILALLPEITLRNGSHSIPETGEATDPLADALEVRGLLGEGGMGLVRLAYQPTLSREIAIKQIKPFQISYQTLCAILQEASITGILEHPNIIPVYALARDKNNYPVILMRRVEGVTWRTLLQEPDNPHWAHIKGDRWQWHFETFMQICNAVHFAHTKGILHRDIKPENVMICGFGQVYLLDWGLGLHLKRDDDSQPSRELVGTLSYMAPEMLEGEKDGLSERTDIYLLGATLHEILTGKPRHTGEHIVKITSSIIKSEPYDYPTEIPHSLAEICNKATHVDPAQRFQSVPELQEAIANYLQYRESLQLTQIAEQKLHDLREHLQARDATEDTRSADIHRCFYECRFGFEQALRSWPENQKAQQGLQYALLTMCEYQIQKREYLAAKALFDELEETPVHLRMRLAMLREERAEQEDAVKKLQAIEHDLSFSVSKTHRIWGGIAAGLSLSVSGCVMIYSGLTGRQIYTFKKLFIALSIFFVASLIVLYAFRSYFLATKVNRRWSLTVILVVGTLLLHRILGYMFGWSFNPILITDLLIVGALSTLAGLTISWRFLVAGAICIIASFAAAFWTRYTLVFVGMTELLCMGWFLFGLLHSRKKAQSA